MPPPDRRSRDENPSSDEEGFSSQAETLPPRSPLPSVGDAATVAPDAAQFAETLPPGALTAADAPPGYVIEKELGRGGMGVVYLARQEGLKRPVALKMILSGAHAGERDLARFRAEAETVAALRHPNVVQIYEVGAHAGRPFMALEYCDGGSLDKKLAGVPLPPRDAAELAATLARALHAAHALGIVHRDLKPANVLLSVAARQSPVVAAAGSTSLKSGGGDAGASDRRQQQLAAGDRQLASPKVTDFGLAKRAGSADGLTASGAIMGTPSYMAPEQAGGGTKDVGPAADVYALGAMLYEFLTGRPPFRAATVLDTVLMVVKADPVPPTQLAPKTPRDLETICLKCLHKDPARRFPTAEALAGDLERWLGGEPITSRPVGAAERAWKWVKRNKGVTAAAASIALALLLGTAVAWREAARADRNAERAIRNEDAAKDSERVAKSHERQATEARDNLAREQRDTLEYLYASRVSLAHKEWSNGISLRAMQILDDAPATRRGWEYDFLRAQFQPERLVIKPTVLTGYVLGSPDGSLVVTLSADNVLRVWDARTGVGLRWQQADNRGMAFARDGRLAVAAGRHVAVSDRSVSRELFRSPPLPHNVAAVAWSADERHLLAMDMSGQFHRLASDTGRIVESPPWRVKLSSVVARFIGVGVTPVISPDGKYVAFGTDDQAVDVWSLETGGRVLALKGHVRSVGRCAFSPDGKHLASAGGGGSLLIHEIPGGKLVRSVPLGYGLWSAAYSPDGTRIAVGSRGTVAQVVSAASGELIRTLRGHTSEVGSVSFTSDGERLITGGFDGTVRVWDATDPIVMADHVRADLRKDAVLHFGRGAEAEAAVFYGHLGTMQALALSPDGRLAASAAGGDGGGKGLVVVWDIEGKKERLRLPGKECGDAALAFSPDGRRLAYATAGRPGAVGAAGPARTTVLDVTTGGEVWAHDEPACSGCAVTFSPDGEHLLTTLQTATVRDNAVSGKSEFVRRESASGREAGRVSVPAPTPRPAFLSNDEIVLGYGMQNQVQVWNVATGKNTRGWTTAPNLTSVAVAGGKVLTGHVRANATAFVQVQDDHGKPGPTMEGHVGVITVLAPNPDGSRVLSTGNDFSARVWAVETGRELLAFRDHRAIISDAAWSADGTRIGTADRDGVLRVWSAPPRAPASDEWDSLYSGGFAAVPPPDTWERKNGDWGATGGALVGTLRPRDGDKTMVARLRSAGPDIPRLAEVTAEVEVSAPMLAVLRLADPPAQRDWAAFVSNKTVGNFADIGARLVYTNDRMKPANILSTATRRAELVPGKRHAFRLLREPERLRLFLDGHEVVDERLPPIDLPRLELEGSFGNDGDTITLRNVLVRAPAEAVRERALRAKAESLFRKNPLRDAVREQLLAEPGADKEKVAAAVGELVENPFLLRADALGLLFTRGDKTDLERARRQLERAFALLNVDRLDGPNDSLEYAMPLALARHLVGDKPAAREMAARVVGGAEARFGSPSPHQLALLALAEHALGNTDAAKAALVRMRDIDRPEAKWPGDRELGDELDAARTLAATLAPPDPVREAVKDARLAIELAGWKDNDHAAYMAGRTADSVAVARREEKPGPHDITFDREKLARRRKLDFAGEASKTVRFIHDRFRIDAAGDAATVECRSVVRNDEWQYLGEWETITTLRKDGGAWKIARIESWQLREGLQVFDADHWKKKDAAVSAAKTDREKATALVEARRFAEAWEVAKRVTADEKATAGDWALRKQSAFEIGEADDAVKAAREAHKRDAKQELPAWAK